MLKKNTSSGICSRTRRPGLNSQGMGNGILSSIALLMSVLYSTYVHEAAGNCCDIPSLILCVLSPQYHVRAHKCFPHEWSHTRASWEILIPGWGRVVPAKHAILLYQEAQNAQKLTGTELKDTEARMKELSVTKLRTTWSSDWNWL
jgi:hypothetical protein